MNIGAGQGWAAERVATDASPPDQLRQQLRQRRRERVVVIGKCRVACRIGLRPVWHCFWPADVAAQFWVAADSADSEDKCLRPCQLGESL